MLTRNLNGLSFLQFEHLAACEGVRHAIFTRSGGVSRGAFASLNVSLGVGDDPGRVKANRDAIAGVFPKAQLVDLRQVHGTRVVEVTDGGSPAGGVQADALVTGAADQALMIKTADCQSVMLFDPLGHRVANIHSGWRGSVGNIIGATVKVMTERFGSRASDLIAGIGPSLGPCCAEFVNYHIEFPHDLWHYKDSRDHFNFWDMSRDQLIDAGLKAEQVETGGLCTRCRPDLFFSYRGQGVTGRFAAVIALVDPQWTF